MNNTTPFELDGVIYSLTHPRTFEIEGKFRLWAEGEAYRVLLPHRELLGPAEFQRQADGWRHDCARKLYAYGSDGYVDLLYSVEGTTEMAFMQFVHAQVKAQDVGGQLPEMTREILGRVRNNPAKWRELQVIVLGLKPDPEVPNA